VNGLEQKGHHPSREFNGYPRPRLRSFGFTPDSGEKGTHRLLRADGIVEFTLAHPRRDLQHASEGSRLYLTWVMQLVVGVLCQVEWLRQKLALNDVPFGLEVEARGENPFSLLLHGDRFESSYGRITARGPVILPRLQIGAIDDFDTLLSTLLLDLSNMWGEHWALTCTAPWTRLLPKL
jgi:hypothetical protein